MSSAAGGSGTANGAAVSTAEPDERQAYLDAIADDAEKAVKTIEAKLAGTKDSLADAKAEAKRARAEANEGR